MAQQTPAPVATSRDRSAERQLEADLLARLHDFKDQTGRCVSEVRVINAAMYEGGRCPAAVHVRVEL